MRELTGLHDSIYLGETRNPRFKVFLYDQTDTLSDIVLDRAMQTPLEITKYIKTLSINEQIGSATTLNMSVNTPSLEVLSPYIFCGRKIIRVLYIDEAIKSSGEDWVYLFTGPIVGQPGFSLGRESVYEISVKCEDRSHFYKNRTLESEKFEEGEDLGEVAVSVATDAEYGLCLDREECKFGLFFSEIAHTQISLFDVTMIEGLQLLGFVVDREPGFDSAGFLRFYDSSIEKPPARKYQDVSLFKNITWPQSETEAVNKIRIVGLSNLMSKVVSPVQELVTLSGTVGYFQKSFKQRVYFTEDRQGRADNPHMSDYSVNGQLGALIGVKPKIKSYDEFSAVIYIETPYQPWLFIAFFLTYVAFFVISAFFGGIVEKVVLVAAAGWLCVGLAFMQQIGTFDVTVSGEPYKMVYKEIEATAEWANLAAYEINEKTIENHLIYNQTLADSIALRELKREKMRVCERSFSIPHDPALEIYDIIELSDGSRYFITSISKTFGRDDACMMDLSAFMVRSGLEYGGESGYPEY